MSSSTFYTYDADQISIVFFGILIESGLADGEFCRIENQEDSFTTYVGTDGAVTRSKTKNNTATITLITSNSAGANNALSALWNVDIEGKNGSGVGPILIKDRSGTSLYTAEKCWITKPPSASFDRGATTREWVLMAANLKRLDGGN